MGLLAAIKHGGCSAQKKLQASVKRQGIGLNRPVHPVQQCYFLQILFTVILWFWPLGKAHCWCTALSSNPTQNTWLTNWHCKPSFLLISQKIPSAAHIAEKGLFQLLKLQADHKHVEKQQPLFFYPTPASQILPWAAGCVSSLLW